MSGLAEARWDLVRSILEPFVDRTVVAYHDDFFVHDRREIISLQGPATRFWCCRPTGTHMLRVGDQYGDVGDQIMMIMKLGDGSRFWHRIDLGREVVRITRISHEELRRTAALQNVLASRGNALAGSCWVD